MAGFATVFPILYIPVINRKVFKHEGISWEWGVVFVESILFFLGIETWKWIKRVYIRTQVKKTRDVMGTAGEADSGKAIMELLQAQSTHIGKKGTTVEHTEKTKDVESGNISP